MTSWSSKWLYWSLVALVAGALAAGCGARVIALRDPGAVLLPVEQNDEAVRQAVVRALKARSFTAEQDEPGRIVARLDHRGVQLRVAIEYSGRQYTISYVDSDGLGYEVGEDGTPVISRQYARYVQRLSRTIDSEIGRPEREAREALEEQRRHELALAEQARRAADDERRAESRERERDRQAALEAERLRATAAIAEAEARRPVIVGREPVVVAGLAFETAAPAPVRYGSIALATGFMPDPRVVRGTTGSQVGAEAMSFPRGCRGYYGGQPDHLLSLSTPMSYLRLDAVSSADTTLAIVAPDGAVYCDDDGGMGTNARIEGQFPPGTYQVFVGTYRPGPGSPYELYLSELPAGGAAAVPVAAAPVVAAPPPPPDCRTLLIELGHSPAHAIHCEGAEPRCAAALLRAGHAPAHLIHCQGVEPTCAEALLRSGRSPAELIHCH